MADLARIKRNVAKMADMNAPESDIDGYIESEGATIDDIRAYKAEPQNPFTFARDAVESGQVEAPKGFQDRMAQDDERARQKIEKSQERNLAGQSDLATKITNLGAVAGLGWDTLGNIGGSAARYGADLIPDEIKLLGRFEAERLKNNPAVQAAKEPAMQGVQYVGKKYGEFEEKYPTTAGLVDATANLLPIIPAAKGVKAGADFTGKKLANALDNLATPKQVVPDSQQFADMGVQAYERARASGEMFAPDVSNNFVTAIESAKPRKIANAVETELSKELEAGLGKYRGLQDRGLGIDEIDIIDKDLSNLKEQAYSAGKNQLGSELANIQNALRGSVIDSPSGQALAEGRDFFRKKYQMEDIERIFRNAEGRPNEAAIIQTGFRNLANQARKKGSGYSTEQIALMDKAAKGGLSIDALKLASSRLLPMVAGASGGAIPAMGAYMGNLAATHGASTLQKAKGMKLAESITKGMTVDAPPTRLNKIAQALSPRREVTEYPQEQAAKQLLLPSPDDFKGGGFGAPSAEKLAGIQAIKESQGYTLPIYMGDKAAKLDDVKIANKLSVPATDEFKIKTILPRQLYDLQIDYAGKPIKFRGDIDKAAYVLSQGRQKGNEAAFDLAQKLLLGDKQFTQDAIDKLTKRIANHIAQKGAGEGKTISVPKIYKVPTSNVEMPVLNEIKRRGGVNLNSPLASELKLMGITPKTTPALFKKTGGLKDVDNFPAGEWKSSEFQLLDEDNGYVPRQHILDKLDEEVNQRSKVSGDISYLDEIERLASDYDIDTTGKTLKEIEEEIRNAKAYEQWIMENLDKGE
jgi:hypothetical protein